MQVVPGYSIDVTKLVLSPRAELEKAISGTGEYEIGEDGVVVRSGAAAAKSGSVLEVAVRRRPRANKW